MGGPTKSFWENLEKEARQHIPKDDNLKVNTDVYYNEMFGEQQKKVMEEAFKSSMASIKKEEESEEK